MTKREKLHATMRRALGDVDDDRFHAVLDDALNRGPIHDEQPPVDTQGTPLAFGNEPATLDPAVDQFNVIHEFNERGARQRGEVN
jgi:hypothetical protein